MATRFPESFRGKGPLTETSDYDCAIQQFLANENPDVDAVFRLTNEGKESFHGEDVVLESGTWCPFNSQNTLWWPEAFAYLYLPCTATFRMTDIWRSFVAQRCLYAKGGKVAFRGATMFQERNEHSLIKDFADEISGYLNNLDIMNILADLEVDSQAESVLNLKQCYAALIAGGYLEDRETALVGAWIHDFHSASTKQSR